LPRPERPGAREEILVAAGSLFYGRGTAAVSMNDIMGAAGCGKNLLYRYFPGTDHAEDLRLLRATAT